MSFVEDEIHLGFHFFLVDKLGRVELAISLIPAEVDLAESAHSDALEHVVGLQSFELLILVGFEDAL